MALSKVGKNQVDQSASLTVDSDLTVDTNTLYVDSTNNRIGVGTASPSYLIDAQTASGNAQVQIKSGGDLAQLILQSADTTGNSQINFADADSNNVGMLQYFHSDNHMEFTVNSSEAMRIDSSGRVTMPSQPFFHGYWLGATKAAGWNFPSVTPTSRVNRGGHYNSSTGQFTCPVAGDYEIACGGYIVTASNGVRVGISFDKNGNGYVIGGGQLSTGDSPFPWSKVTIPCSANDTLRVGSIYTPIAITLGSTLFYSFNVQIRLIG